MKRVVISALALSLSLVGASVRAADEAPKGEKGDREARLLERFDANKDGKLDDAEKAKAKEAMAERRKDGGGPRGEEFRARMLEKYDANKDGKLDDAEKAKAREEFRKNNPGGRRGEKSDAKPEAKSESKPEEKK